MMAEEDIPGALAGWDLIIALLNTRYGQRKRLHDAWPDRDAMEIWLREQHLIEADATVTEGDYRRAVAMRESLRHILRKSGDDDAATGDALETLNALSHHLLLEARFSDEAQIRLTPESGGVDGILARVLGEAYAAQLTGTWMRLKICHNVACGKAFYDSSKNHAGLWCSMKVCGNRMHARAYRQQKKQADSTQA